MLGVVLGFLTGIIGLVIIAVIPRSRAKKVRDAAERLAIEEDARRVAAGQPPVSRQQPSGHVHRWVARKGGGEACSMCLVARPPSAPAGQP